MSPVVLQPQETWSREASRVATSVEAPVLCCSELYCYCRLSRGVLFGFGGLWLQADAAMRCDETRRDETRRSCDRFRVCSVRLRGDCANLSIGARSTG